MDESRWPICETLADADVKAWRGNKVPHMYVWFMFEVTLAGPRAKILDMRKLQRLFDALEVYDPKDETIAARSGAILLTDSEGFHMIAAHMEQRAVKTKAKMWDSFVVNYMAEPEDGFPEPVAGNGYNVFIVFIFGHCVDESKRACFKDFFPGLQGLKQVYKAKDMAQVFDYWMRPRVPHFRVSSALEIFRGLKCPDHVLVNVNGGPEFTYLGLVSTLKFKYIHDFYLSRKF
jgi:hypothetical protein